MSEQALRDAYTVAVKGTYAKPILPANSKEICTQNVVVSPDGKIEGGVLCRDFLVKEGPFQVDGAVFSSNSFSAVLSSDKISDVKNTVMTSGTLNVESSGSGWLRVRGDIGAEVLNLDGAVIYGNVYAEQSYIKNSLIFGHIISKDSLEIENTFTYGFRSQKITTNAGVCLAGFSACPDKGFTMNYPISTVAILPLVDFLTEDSEEAIDKVVDIYHDEIFEKQIADPETNTISTIKVLSPTDRFLNLEKVKNTIQENEAFLSDLTLVYHGVAKQSPDSNYPPPELVEGKLMKLVSKIGDRHKQS